VAHKEYLILKNFSSSKRRGYVAIIFLFSAILFIIPTLAITFRQVLKFNDLTGILLAGKQEKIAILTSNKESIEHLSTDIPYILSRVASVNPSSSSELLIHENSGTIGDYSLSSKVYYMNYVISDDTVMSDALNYPPSQKIVADERHILLVTAIHKNELPSRREETALEITSTGQINELWHREY